MEKNLRWNFSRATDRHPAAGRDGTFCKDIRFCLVESAPSIHPQVREGWRDGPLQCVWRCKTAIEALHCASRISVDAIVVSAALSDMTGIECIDKLSLLAPTIPKIFLADAATRYEVLRALLAGAKGYVVRQEGWSRVVSAILDVAEGRPSLSSVALASIVELLNGACVGTNGRMRFTRQEREVISRLLCGARPKEVSIQLNCSVQTVRKHIRNIYASLQAHSLEQAIAILLEMRPAKAGDAASKAYPTFANNDAW